MSYTPYAKSVRKPQPRRKARVRPVSKLCLVKDKNLRTYGYDEERKLLSTNIISFKVFPSKKKAHAAVYRTMSAMKASGIPYTQADFNIVEI